MDPMGRQRLLFPVVFLTFLLTATVAWAQGVGASGEITGTVTDSTGGLLPKATVTVVNTETGLRREAITNDSGQYLVAGLPPATYEVSAQFSGFGTRVRKGFTVTIGETAVCDFSLRPQSQTVIEVTGEAVQVETQRASQANTITQSYIINLPIDRRDYLTFTLLAPGVSSSDRTAGDQDFRVKQTPQSGLSFYGSNGRGNSITVDGGETSGDSGGVRPTVSQDAVQEFQVKRSNFGPELGSATGASINIVTKSGTNKVHGSLFGFFRNDVMDAANPFSFSQALQPGQTFDPAQPDLAGSHVKDSLSRQQFGGSMGFPLKKDKTFGFVAFEGLLGDAQNAVPILTNTNVFRPTADQDAIIGQLANQSGYVTCFPGVTLPASICAFALNSILTVNPNPGANPFISTFQGAMNGFLVNQFETEGGVFPFTTRQYLASGRLDHRFNESNQVSLTYRFAHDVEQSPDVHSLTAFSAGSSTHTQDHNLQGAWFHQFGMTAQNELRIQWNHEDFNVLPNVPGEVGLQIPGFINNLGTSIFLPNITTLRRTEYADNFTVFHGHHVFQFGGAVVLRGNDTASNTFLPGRFVFGSLPGALISPELASTTINPLQAASFGLPQIYQQGFGNPQYPYYSRPLTGLYWRDSWTVTPGFVVKYGLRYELDSQFEPLGTYTKDFAPRISFSWDPFKDQKTVIRGGYGIFYSPIDVQIPDVDMSLGVLNSNRTAVGNNAGAGQVANLLSTCGVSIAGGFPIIPGSGSSPCNREISIYVDPITSTGIPGLQTAPVVFQTLFAQGLIQCTTPTPGNQACITPASVAPLGIRVANSGPISPLQVVFVNQPGYRPPIAQQASLGIEREITTGFSIALSGIYTHTQRLPIAIDTNLLPAGFSTLTLANGQKVSYRNWNTNPLTDPAVLLSQPGYTEPCAASPLSCFVNPLVVQNNQYSSLASALYEGLILEGKKRFSDHFTLFGNYTFSKGYDNSTDYNTDYGPQDPINIGLDRSLSEFDERHKVVVAGVFQSPWKSPILSGFELAPIFTYHSGHPFNLLASGVSVNGNNHTTNERPIGAPRDTGLGPDYLALDMRLSWKHKTGEWGELQITAEGFNIANRVNYAGVNNEVNPLFGFLPGFTTFKVHGLVPGSPLPGGGTVTSSTPLAFTSAYPMRQVQLGVRFTF